MSSSDKLLKKISKDKKTDLIPEQLKQYGQRYASYRKNYAAADSHEYEGDFPLYVLFEQTFLCNLACPCCLMGYPAERKKYDTGIPVMPLELFKKVILECKERGCPSVAMHNIDEPLLVKDIMERIRLAKQHGIMDVIMATNGQLLTESLAREICNAGLTHILFSIDAATPETYSRLRGKALFKKTLDGISYIRRWRQEKNSSLPIIRASFVLNKENYFEEGLFIERFQEIVDYIDIQSFYSVGNVNKYLVPDDHIPVNPRAFVCSEPFRKVIIRANGDVAPCCSKYGYRQIAGNVYENCIYEIFNNEKMKKLRKQLKEKKFNGICRECVSNIYEKRE